MSGGALWGKWGAGQAAGPPDACPPWRAFPHGLRAGRLCSPGKPGRRTGRVCRGDVRGALGRFHPGPQPTLLGPPAVALAPRAWGAVRGGVSLEASPNGCNVRQEPGPLLPCPLPPPPPPHSRNWMRCDTPGFSPTFWDGLSLSWPKRPLDRPGRLERFNCLGCRFKNFPSPLLPHKWRKTPPPHPPPFSPFFLKLALCNGILSCGIVYVIILF